MTSDFEPPQAAFVWAWLPGAEEPVAVGRVDRRADRFVFGYGLRYLERPDAMSLYAPELPLRPGPIEPLESLDIAGCILDAGPDSWGQRVILNRLLGPTAVDTGVLDHLTYLLASGSNRIGALDFQASPTEYKQRGSQTASLEMLSRVVELIQAGEEVPADLQEAVTAGSSAGGARPKALLRDGDVEFIAKFSAPTDTYPIVRGEFLAMRMARLCGLDVADVKLTTANGKDVLLVKRFDRIPGTRQRLGMVSALTMLELPESAPREASYAKLAQIIRERFVEPRAALDELYARIVFNVLCGNTDDHARNHAAFWDGELRRLTPAYDICPYVRGGGEAAQAMIIGPPENPVRFANLAVCVANAPVYGLRPQQARDIIDHQLATIRDNWDELCDEARLGSADRAILGRVFPAAYALEDYEPAAA